MFTVTFEADVDLGGKTQMPPTTYVSKENNYNFSGYTQGMRNFDVTSALSLTQLSISGCEVVYVDAVAGEFIDISLNTIPNQVAQLRITDGTLSIV